MPQTAPLEAEPLELALMVRSLRRHLRLSVAIILGCLAIAALLSLILPRSYTAETTLMYDPQLPLIKGGGALAMTDAQRDAEIDAQLAAVTTLAVAEHVAQSVDLAANPRLQRETERWAARSERRPGRDEALGMALLYHVKARRTGQTPAFTIAFTASSAVQAARIANGFAASYLAAAARQKAASIDGGAPQLAIRVAELHERAGAADGELAAFRLAHNLLAAPDSTALEQEVAALRGQWADARGAAALAGARSTAANGTIVVGGGYGGSVDTTAVSALTQQHAATAADLAALLGRYGEKYPDVIAAREKLAEVAAQLTQAMRGNRNSAMVEARATSARAATLAGSVADAEARLTASLGHEASLRGLQNSALAVRQEYQDALKIDADQATQRSLIQPDARQIALALPPLQPHSPGLGLILPGGLLIGIGAAAMAAFVRQSWQHTLGSVDDIPRWLDADYFAPLPALASAMWRPDTRDPFAAVLLHPHSAFAESFRSLGTAALFAARKRGTAAGEGCVIGITSALPGEGKTTACIAMGRLLALAGMKVALVDGDPQGGAQIGMIAHDPLLLGSSRIDSTGLALLSGASAGEMVQLVATLRRDYEVVIVDIIPVSMAVAGGDLLAAMDALVLLARWRATPVRAIREAMRRIVAVGGQVSGVALSLVG